MNKPTSRLGRGLSALIPAAPHAATPVPTKPADTAPSGDTVRRVRLDHIQPNRHQPRTTFNEPALQELAESIKTTGVLQPILVRALPEGRYELVAGERRWRAARLAGLAEIPALVKELSDEQSFQLALVENLQREDLGPLERAAAYQHYLETFGGTIEALAASLGESRANISNYIRLLKLRPEICYMLGAGELGMGQARAIAGIIDAQRQLAIAKLAARRNLSVRQVEELAREADASPDQAPHGTPRVPTGERKHFDEVQTALSRSLGVSVRLVPGRKKNTGRIVISYDSLADFERIAERLGAEYRLE